MQKGTVHANSAGICQPPVRRSTELGRCGGLRTLFAAAVLLASLLLPALSQAAECVGDCDGDDKVLVNELIIGVNIALGTDSLDSCPVFDANQDGEVTVSELIKAVNYALEGCPGGEVGLGERIFSILTTTTPFSPSRSMLGSSAVGGANVAGGFSPGPLVLVAGAPGDDGVASLALATDAIFGMAAIDGSVACYKFFAEGSTGSIDCDGGPAPNVVVSQDSGADVPPPVITIEEGDPTGPGAAVIQLNMASVSILSGATVNDCATQSFGTPVPQALTTATATGIKGEQTLGLTGENFSCEQWTTENGPGMLVMAQVSVDPRAGGDTVAVLRIADN
jgi:hypothetical protein